MYFRSKIEKVNITIEFYKLELVWVPNFTLDKQFWILGPNLPKKGIFRSKMQKVDTTIESYIFELVSVSNFSLNLQFWFFGPNVPKERIYGIK